MSIPDIPEIKQVLSALRIVQGDPHYDHAAVVQLPLMPAVDESGQPTTDISLFIQHSTNTAITFEGLLGRVSKELTAAQHPGHREFSLFVLSFYARSPAGATGSVEAIRIIYWNQYAMRT